MRHLVEAAVSRKPGPVGVPNRPWVEVCLSVLLTVLGLSLAGGAGCAGRKPKSPPPPRASAEADRLSQQAARLQSEENWAGAAEWWRRAGIQFQLLNREADVALAGHNEGVSRKSLGQIPAARQLLEAAAESNARLGLTNAWWRNQVALLQLEIETDPSPAEAVNRHARLKPKAAEIADDPRLAALFSHEEARLHLRTGEFAEAASEADRSAAAFQVAGDPVGKAAVGVTRARILAAQHQLAPAEAAWREAVAAFEKLAHPRGVAVSLAGLGTVLAADQARSAEARELLGRAIANLRVLRMEAEAKAAEATLAGIAAPDRS